MLTELGALIDLLRSKGVTHYAGPLTREPTDAHPMPVFTDASGAFPSVTLELAPLVAPDDGKQPKPISENCACGCPLFAHINGLCGQGCAESLCTSQEKPE